MKKIFLLTTVSAVIFGTAVLAGAQVLEGDGILDSVADSGWNIQTVDSTGDVGYETSLALDAGGNAHISYYDATNADLKYVAWSGSSWNIETVDSEGTVGRQSSLALDSSGYPHISYSYRYWYNYDSLYDLKYAAWNSPAWLG